MQKKTGTFDALKLSREGGLLQGTLDVEASERLEDRVMPGPSIIEWKVEGTTDRSGRPALAITLNGEVPLECQRCLGEFRLPVAQRTITVLARSEAEADSLDADCEDEVLVVEHALDPVELVEDELLLTLPYAPMHEEGACVAADPQDAKPEE